ncbi:MULTISPECIES: methyl-accepting chemotaxis protein [Aeribacillus]|uniref:Methyl-accepting chemotaxis protein n=1 Tax=Aeribacillus composti TaxID=1868734 RepID=A0ABY9WDW6_9BACI|nr:methyl-accepting chemotaxis protein [Aeribacillus composti]MED0703533.1 methyl-accepting chemotaxis protein [Aeribacillus composti]WNF34346.1 methyl-accepting chemotaxis protein [Aeribacillus composti]BBU39035.1 putative sensory transducer protein YvaQ [Aeribacillus pallidus]
MKKNKTVTRITTSKKQGGLRRRLLRSFGILMLLTCLMAVINFGVIKNLTNHTESIMKEDVEGLIQNEKMRYNIAERISLINQFLLYGDRDIRQKYEELAKQSSEIQKQLLKLNSSQQMKDLVAKCHQWELLVRHEVLFDYDMGKKNDALKQMKESVQPLGETIIQEFEKVTSDRQNDVIKSGNNMIQLSNLSIIIILAVLASILLIGFIMSFKMARSITNPLIKIAGQMEQISKGNLILEPLSIKSKDEIGELMEAVNEMGNQLRKIVQDIHHASDTMSKQSSDLLSSSKELKEGSNQIAATMQELSAGAESQANSASELSEAMGMYMDKIYQIHRNGKEMFDKSREVLELTDNGSKLMNQSKKLFDYMFTGMQSNMKKIKKLDERSKQISKLVEVIQSIADQTNLLALNAAIEAARAGEHGKGFAVVADEVRKLAEQVSSSVVDIQKIVEEVHSETNKVTKSFELGFQQVESGMDSMNETSAAFQQIKETIKEISERINNAQNDLTDMLSTSESINDSISNIASISEEAAAGIEQTSASAATANGSAATIASHAESMSNLAGDLQSLVKRFQVQ